MSARRVGGTRCRAALTASVGLALVLAVAPATQAQTSTVTLTASPNPFTSGATITLTATVTSGGTPGGCYEWEGCLLGAPVWFVHVYGPSGYYRYHEGEVSWGTSVQFTDSGPGQTMQPATYTATGAVVWPVCTQWVPGWGCFEQDTWEEGYGNGQVTATPTATPVPISATPSSGAGPTQTFSFQYSSPTGATDIRWAWQVMHSTMQTTQSCVVGVEPPTNTVVLKNDSGVDVSVQIGQNVVLENSQCRLLAGGVSASPSGNTLTVVVPVEFKASYAGPKNVYMQAGNSAGNWSAWLDAGDWTARARIDSVAPGATVAGGTVTVSGRSFGGVQGSSSVTVNGAAAAVTSWSETAIQAVVPGGVSTGPVLVWTNGQSSNAQTLVIQTGPVIYGPSPSWGPVGTSVVVTGANFGSTKGTSTIKFNGITASTTAWSSTSITATVPAGATNGLVKVTKASVQSNGVPFTVGSEEVVYYTTDGIGSVRMITTFDQHVVARYDYLPFGEEWQPSGGHAQPVEFAGKEQNKETGSSGWQALNYFGARYLHSSTGRFTSVDPVLPTNLAILEPQRWNRYAYVMNRPLVVTDPDGRCPGCVYAQRLWQIATNIASRYGTPAYNWATRFFNSPQGQDAVELAAEAIGLGGNVGRLSVWEKQTGTRLAQKLGEVLEVSEHVGSEFVTTAGKTIDAMGVPHAYGRFWNWEQFALSIERHLSKSNDFTVIDLTGASPQQIAQIKQYIVSLGKEAVEHFLYVGD